MGEELLGKATAVPQSGESDSQILADIAKKIQALDNPVKLKILSSLVKSGALSITDIAKKLDINFSTAHKYLEQLEAAGLVASKQISENRLKRVFTIKDFNIELSPKSLFQKTIRADAQSKARFKLFNEKGELVDFDEENFSQKYIKRGMPRGTVLLALQEILPQTYNGITILELRQMFRQALEKRRQNIVNVFQEIDNDLHHKRTYAHLLSVVHPEALELHANGTIFIKNLREPKLLNFVHDLRGIAVHGTTGKEPKDIHEMLGSIQHGVNFITPLLSGGQAFDSFNYFLAPYAKSLSDAELKRALENFFDFLKKSDTKFYLALEVGVPEFMKTLSTGYWIGKEEVTYETLKNVADKVTNLTLELFRQHSYENIELVLKVWQKKLLEAMDVPKNAYIANMSPRWQHPNASFIDGTRLNPEWKKWVGTTRAGEIQEVVINIPRIALDSSSIKEFLDNLGRAIDLSCDFIENMAELSLGQFLRKYKLRLKSIQTSRWSYVSTEQVSYAVSLTGLKDAEKILAAKAQNTGDFAEKTLQKCDEILDKRVNIPIRVLLKENVDANISKRFYSIDAKANPGLQEYTPGLSMDIAELHLQKNLWGGCCANINKGQLRSLKKVDFGLIKVV